MPIQEVDYDYDPAKDTITAIGPRTITVPTDKLRDYLDCYEWTADGNAVEEADDLRCVRGEWDNYGREIVTPFTEILREVNWSAFYGWLVGGAVRGIERRKAA